MFRKPLFDWKDVDPICAAVNIVAFAKVIAIGEENAPQSKWVIAVAPSPPFILKL